MEEGINGSGQISQPCLPNSASKNEISKINANGNQDYIEIRSCHVDERLNWTMLEQGFSPTN